MLLLDEPASALDPIATASIEELMHTLKHRYTIVIVTHNMQQAARVADLTAFFNLEAERTAARRHADRVRRDRADIHPPRGPAHARLRDRKIRLIGPSVDDRRRCDQGVPIVSLETRSSSGWPHCQQ